MTANSFFNLQSLSPVRVSVGVRFHDISKLNFLRRCLISIDSQSSVEPHIYLVTQGFNSSDLQKVEKLLGE